MPTLFIPGKIHQSARRHKGPSLKTPQHILVIGDCEQAASKLPLVDADNYRFSYCAGDNRDSESIIKGRPFDWILFDGNSLCGDQTDLIRSLRTIGFFSSETTAQGRSRCQLEWNEQGVLQLHCCMQAKLRNSAAGQSDEDQDGCVFEFHGPMKRAG
jgi:hypothetical protein